MGKSLALIRSKNSVYVYNPSFFKKKNTPVDIDAFMDYTNYQNGKLGKIVHIFHGRGNTYLINDVNDYHFILRHYWRGGFIGKILKDRFLAGFESSKRAENEFRMLVTMKKMGLPVPTPIVARQIKSFIFVRNDIAIQEVPGAFNLQKILQKRRLTDEEIIKIGGTLGKMFLSGVYHSDLNIKNILIDGADNPWIIDFDKCNFCSVGRRRREAMMNRLKRSFDKELALCPGLQWSDNDFQKLKTAVVDMVKNGRLYIH